MSSGSSRGGELAVVLGLLFAALTVAAAIAGAILFFSLGSVLGLGAGLRNYMQSFRDNVSLEKVLP